MNIARSFQDLRSAHLGICALCQGMGLCRRTASDAVCGQLCKCVHSYSTILFTAECSPLSTCRHFVCPPGNGWGRQLSRRRKACTYKRLDLLIAACNRVGADCGSLGFGPEERKLRALAGRSIEFLGHVESEVLWNEYARCRALLFAAEEDFGMVPVEAQACGRPVIAYGKGGALESVVPGSGMGLAGSATGVFFHEQSVGAFCDAISSSNAENRNSTRWSSATGLSDLIPRTSSTAFASW